ncbi:Uncharacterized ABC transporter ATP-binding protein HI_1470 [Oligella urethralis]|uniref:ABC transporter ATP-binding protein n=1 Tax=Oligella urethralis TaxID=90245 RepID=UPI000DF9CE49|nr:ABC transporter ATP-binding protein [Oligella urethralis]SUA51944.1 Uncharacterized ABC transporter ATP-binding protein HI_1470 [Oligella urethralis]SUA65476.1 Uncharacterized ABC transporter ATP-binding protein HI_1470 [Oligella urethralis]
MAKQASILSVRDLAIGYANKRVAEGISFELEAGQVLCLLGPNGSGKSTLLKTVLALLPSLGGSVQLLAKDVAQWRRREIAQTLAFVPQQSSMSFSFSALDMVLMGRSAHVNFYASPSKADREIAAQSLERLGISHLAERLFPQMSGGEQQLVLLARALAQQPKALILDEPTASLDFANQILVLEQIQQLRQQGLAILLCTHQPEHAARVADTALLLAAGRPFALGRSEDVLSVDNLAAVYGLESAQVRDYLQSRLFKEPVLAP